MIAFFFYKQVGNKWALASLSTLDGYQMLTLINLLICRLSLTVILKKRPEKYYWYGSDVSVPSDTQVKLFLELVIFSHDY